MATLDAVFIPSNDVSTATLGAASSSAEIVVGKNRILYITASADSNIKFGVSGMGAATAADIPIWGKTYSRFDTGEYDRVRVFSTPGATYFIVPLVK